MSDECNTLTTTNFDLQPNSSLTVGDSTIGYVDTTWTTPCPSLGPSDWMVPGTVYASNFEVVADPAEIPEDYSRDPEETKTHLVYTLPYPGMSQKNLDMYIREDVLVITNDGSSSFVKVGKIEIFIDWDVCNRDDVKAKIENGVLTIAIGKINEDKTIIIQ